MKSKNSKFSIIFTIICASATILLFIVGFVTMFSFKTPNKLDKNYFIKYMEEKGCYVINLQEERKRSGINDYLITDEKTCPYLISYTTFNNMKKLQDFFSKGIKDVFQNNKNVTGKTSISILGYHEYDTSGDHYKVIVHNNNLVLYGAADKQYRNDVKKIFKDLHYKYEINFEGTKFMWYSLFIVIFICLVSIWGTEKKIRNNGWISLIPFYNIWCLSKDILGSGWYCLFLLVPILNILFMLMLFYNLGRAFNKDDSYCILMMFIPTVLWPLLAFDDSKYIKLEERKDVIENLKQALSNNHGNNIETISKEIMNNDKKKYNSFKSVFKSKIFIKLFIIPYICWIVLTMVTLIPDESGDSLTLVDVLIADIFVMIIWFVISFIIVLIIKKIKESKFIF